jgi:hypothetical protein
MSGQIHAPTAGHAGQDAGWAPRAGMDAAENTKHVDHAENRTKIPRLSRLQPSHYTAWAIPLPCSDVNTWGENTRRSG